MASKGRFLTLDQLHTRDSAALEKGGHIIGDMAADESLEVVFVVAPYRPDKKIPRAFQVRLSAAAVAEINEAIASGRSRSYRGVFHDGTAINFVAKATRSRYGFIQLEPTWP